MHVRNVTEGFELGRFWCFFSNRAVLAIMLRGNIKVKAFYSNKVVAFPFLFLFPFLAVTRLPNSK